MASQGYGQAPVQTFVPSTSAPSGSSMEWYSGAGTEAYASGYGGYGDSAAASTSAAAGFGTFDDEPPLLEELGIDVPAIAARTWDVLTFRAGKSSLEGYDMGGPLLFMMALGVAHLLMGKLHFGYILGWTVVGSGLLWVLLNGIAGGGADGGDGEGEHGEVTLYACTCLLGYSQLPLIVHSWIVLLLPRHSPLAAALGVIAILWSASNAARLFSRRTPALRGQAILIAYPAALMYTTFALLTLY